MPHNAANDRGMLTSPVGATAQGMTQPTYKRPKYNKQLHLGCCSSNLVVLDQKPTYMSESGICCGIIVFAAIIANVIIPPIAFSTMDATNMTQPIASMDATNMTQPNASMDATNMTQPIASMDATKMAEKMNVLVANSVVGVILLIMYGIYRCIECDVHDCDKSCCLVHKILMTLLSLTTRNLIHLCAYLTFQVGLSIANLVLNRELPAGKTKDAIIAPTAITIVLVSLVFSAELCSHFTGTEDDHESPI